jgi:hypothetical protein
VTLLNLFKSLYKKGLFFEFKVWYLAVKSTCEIQTIFENLSFLISELKSINGEINFDLK